MWHKIICIVIDNNWLDFCCLKNEMKIRNKILVGGNGDHMVIIIGVPKIFGVFREAL